MINAEVLTKYEEYSENVSCQMWEVWTLILFLFEECEGHMPYKILVCHFGWTYFKHMFMYLKYLEMSDILTRCIEVVYATWKNMWSSVKIEDTQHGDVVHLCIIDGNMNFIHDSKSSHWIESSIVYFVEK